MAFTQKDVDRLESAIASGTLEVEVNNRKIKYRSMNELLKARDLIKREVVNSKSTGGITRYTPDFSQGVDDV